MGADNSRPVDISDAAWERVQKQKLDLMNEERRKRDEMQKEVSDRIIGLNMDFAEYCSACHDVPKIMMVLPSYRERCARARGKVMNDVTGIVAVTINVERANQMIGEIKNM